MLSSGEIAKLEKLIARGKSLREIKKLTGVSIDTASRIGRGLVTFAKRRKREAQRGEPELDAAEPHRCPEGHLIVTRECLICAAEKASNGR